MFGGFADARAIGYVGVAVLMLTEMITRYIRPLPTLICGILALSAWRAFWDLFVLAFRPRKFVVVSPKCSTQTRELTRILAGGKRTASLAG